MDFVCPVVGGASISWAHLAHLGLLGVVFGSGLPLTIAAVVRFRSTVPAKTARPEVGVGYAAPVGAPSSTARGPVAQWQSK
jgi:hypothetical protein